MSINVLNRDYRLVTANKRAIDDLRKKCSRSLGENIFGDYCFKIFEDRDKPCPYCPGKITMETGKPASAEIKVDPSQVIDNREHIILTQAFPIFDEGGEII